MVAWVVGMFAVAALLVVGIVGSQPSACGGCHQKQAPDELASAHETVSCYACHLEDSWWSLPGQKADELLRMYPARFAGGPTLTGPALETSREACLRCHQDVMLGTVVEADGVRINHAECAATGTCDRCHAGTGHGSNTRSPQEPVMEDCIACHREQKARTDCGACHNGRIKEARLAAGPWQVTHGSTWKQTHGMGRLDSCTACHPSDYCAKCHGVPMPHGQDFGTQHGQFALKDRKACETCHKSKAFCVSCHGIEMPHPETFLPKHSSLVEDNDDPTCKRCHAEDDCRNCHAYHIHPGAAQWQLRPKDVRR